MMNDTKKLTTTELDRIRLALQEAQDPDASTQESWDFVRRYAPVLVDEILRAWNDHDDTWLALTALERDGAHGKQLCYDVMERAGQRRQKRMESDE